MSTQRHSDENSNPDHGLELSSQNTVIKLETKPNANKPLLQSNEEASSAKKKLSTFEKKEKTRFEKSGMKKGCLLKYFVKDNQEEDMMHKPSISTRSSNRLRSQSTTSTCTSNYEDENGNSRNSEARNVENGSHSQEDSEVEFVGIISRRQSSNGMIIDVSSDGSVSQEEFESNSPQVSDYDDGEDSVASNQPEDAESGINNLHDEELSSEDKIERWQRQNKRMLQDDDPVPAAELQPPPTKASKLELSSEIMSQEEFTLDKSQASTESTPPLRIVDVYTLSKNPNINNNNNNNITPGTSTASSSSMTSAGEKAKKAIVFYKELENPSLSLLIGKKNWRKVVEVIREDLKNYKLPSRSFVSQLIRKAILCDGSRVSKDAQSDSLELLQEMVEKYPPYNGTGRDPSVKYYKEIFEKVFMEGNTVSNEKGRPLYFFLTELHNRLGVEKNALQVFVLVTELVISQYEIYEKEAGVKIHPPLFQYFLEEKDGMFTYNRYCQQLIDKLFDAKTDEEFCILLKWVDLISRRLGKFPAKQNDYRRMIKDFAKLCSDQSDLGLPMMLNLSYIPFSKLVCEAMFEKLKVVRVDGEDNEVVSEADRSSYLAELSKTLLIKPAGDIVSDVVEEVCKADNTLTFRQVRVNADKSTQQNCDNQGRARKKNVKGETRLHILCRPGQDNPISDVKKHLEIYPDDVNVQDNFGNTPLHDCAKNNKGNIIVTLMELFENNKLDRIDFLARNESLETPMHLAVTYCVPQTTEILVYFATSYGVIDQVLTTANKNGELPFQLAPLKSQIRKKLTPAGYDHRSMLVQGGLTLDKNSVAILEKCFELRKILAWWSQNCL